MTPSLRSLLRQSIDTGTSLDAVAALEVLRTPAADLPEILAASNAMRLRHFGNRVSLCSIVNAKSGRCSEDCRYCAQSSHHATEVATYPLLSEQELLAAYDDAAQVPIRNFSPVTSGCSLDDDGIEKLCQTFRKRPNGQIRWCASLGILTVAQLRRLKEAGLTRYHHNIETARSFYPSICSTHDFDSRLTTLQAAREAGLEVCSGGLLGMGESLEQRVEFALELAGLQVDEIPLNFLMPIKGTPLEKMPPAKPVDILKTIAMVRLTNPRAGIRLAAGRVHLGYLQSMIFQAGCSSMMIGKLLTVSGGKVEDDLAMLNGLEVEIVQAAPVVGS
jgi:biotin synthase